MKAMPLESPDAAPLELWFEFGSHYSYLTVMRIEEAAASRGVPLRWKPFLLGPIFRELGWDSSPFLVQKEKGRYAWIDVARQCRKYGLPWRQPSVFPRAAVLPLRVALLGAAQPWIGAYCRRMMTMNFAEDRDIDSAAAVGEALGALGLPAQQIISDALSDANKLALRRQTEQARRRGIFGAPTFFVGDEMFWGNDRLDDALDCCVAASTRIEAAASPR